MHEYRASSPRARKCLSLGGCSGTRREGILLAFFIGEYSASPRMSRERTDWRPTCRKSTCRCGLFERKERSARMAGGTCPLSACRFAQQRTITICVGSDRSHGIEAVPESLQAKRRADKPLNKSGTKRFADKVR